MRRFALLASILPALWLLLSCGGPPGPVAEAPSFEEARRIAAEHDALIVIDFWRDG